MKIEAEVWEIREGKITSVKINDVAFRLVEEKEAEAPKKKQIQEMATSSLKVGPIVDRVGRSVIHGNVLSAVKHSMENHGDKKQVRKIIKLYRPELATSSVFAYSSVYKNYVERGSKGKGTSTKKILEVSSGCNILQSNVDEILKGLKDGISVRETLRRLYPNVIEGTLKKYTTCYLRYLGKTQTKNMKSQHTNKRQKHKKHAVHVADAIGYDKKYHAWIRKEEEEKVSRALNKWNFVSTTKNIIEETKLSEYRVHAVLSWLMQTHKARRKYDQKIGQNVYILNTEKAVPVESTSQSVLQSI